MKILIITEYFHPSNEIASVRATKLYKYWKRSGNDVHVITMKRTAKQSNVDTAFIDENDIDYVDANVWLYKIFGKQYNANKSKIQSGAIRKRGGVKKLLHGIAIRHYWKMKQKKWKKNCKKVIKKMDFDFDAVFSTFGPKTTLELGQQIKRKHPNVKWVADFRDQPKNNRWVKKLCGNAGLITCVSGGVVNGLGNITPRMRENTIVLENGFDKEDIASVKPTTRPDKFKILYTGTIYPKDDFNPFFRALAELVNENKIDAGKICIEYAGNNFELLNGVASDNGLQNVCKNYGYINREDALKLQAESSVLLMAVWNNVGSEGILSGKVFEYLMQNKPIIALVSGNLGNSALKGLIAETNSGFAYEEANKDKDYDDLKNYMFMQYNNFINGKPLEYKPNKTNIEKYNWANLASCLENCIKNLAK